MIEDLIFGRKPAEEAIEKSMAKKVYLLKNNKGNVAKFQDLAREKKLPVQLVDKAFLDDLAGGKTTRGWFVKLSPTTIPPMRKFWPILVKGEKTPS